MADEFDRAQELDEKMRSLAEASQREKANTLDAVPTGYCLHCNEALHEKGKRWCDSECRDDWELYRSTRSKLRG